MGFISELFGYLLNALYNVFNNYGIAIIIFSIVLRIILIPITIKQQKSMKKSAEIQEEMKEISNEGAKVLHNRSVEIGEKFKIPIITKSTFNDKPGTVISDIIEENTIKSIVKKDVSRIAIIGNGMLRNTNNIKKILDIINEYNLDILEFNISESKVSITFKNIISDEFLNQIHDKLFHEI